MFYTLNLQGKNTGNIYPITCVGEENLQYRIAEAERVDCVDIVSVEADKQLSSAVSNFCEENGITILTT